MQDYISQLLVCNALQLSKVLQVTYDHFPILLKQFQLNHISGARYYKFEASNSVDCYQVEKVLVTETLVVRLSLPQNLPDYSVLLRGEFRAL